MRRHPALWLLCLGLVLSRVLGLHAHACAGIEDLPHVHERTHYADSGLLFGEFHDDDHAGNQEVELSTPAVTVKPFSADGLMLAALPSSPLVVFATGWIRVHLARGPPPAYPPHPDAFRPPLRGPPPTTLS